MIESITSWAHLAHSIWKWMFPEKPKFEIGSFRGRQMFPNSGHENDCSLYLSMKVSGTLDGSILFLKDIIIEGVDNKSRNMNLVRGRDYPNHRIEDTSPKLYKIVVKAKDRVDVEGKILVTRGIEPEIKPVTLKMKLVYEDYKRRSIETPLITYVFQ